MDAIQYLRQEHSKFRKNLAAINKMNSEKPKLAKFEAFCKDLTDHEKMEEKAWYPILRKDNELREIITHLVNEEKSASKAIKKLLSSSYGIVWEMRFQKLKHDVDHHAKEEEKQLFPKVRQFLTKKELTALGTKMRKFKATLK